MTYTAQHPFEQVTAGAYCNVPNCFEEADHPVHAIDRPEIEALARALVANQWLKRPDHPSLDETTEHRRHTHSSNCAVCTQDVHAIAAFAIDYLKEH